MRDIAYEQALIRHQQKMLRILDAIVQSLVKHKDYAVMGDWVVQWRNILDARERGG